MPGMRSRNGGFTLIEVLVALAIVAIGMAAVLSTLTSSAGTVVYMRDKTLANWVALNHIAEQRLLPQMPQLGKTDGDTDFAGQKWHWQQETVATAVQGMVRMDVHVRPADVKTDEDRGWYVTLSGIMGDAVAAPRGDMPLWGSGADSGVPGQNTNQPGTPNSTKGISGSTGSSGTSGSSGTPTR
jgi:general secretion pathway protein I